MKNTYVEIEIFDPNCQQTIFRRTYFFVLTDIPCVPIMVGVIRRGMPHSIKFTWGQPEYLRVLLDELVKNGKSRLGWMTAEIIDEKTL